jgi:hypothetical protein
MPPPPNGQQGQETPPSIDSILNKQGGNAPGQLGQPGQDGQGPVVMSPDQPPPQPSQTPPPPPHGQSPDPQQFFTSSSPPPPSAGYGFIQNTPLPPKRRGNKWIIAVTAVIILIIIVVGATIALSRKQPKQQQETPVTAFRQMLVTSLSTGQVAQQTTVANHDKLGQQTRFDVSDITNPKVLMKIKTGSYDYNGYATLQNSYLNYQHFNTGNSKYDQQLSSLIGIWFQIKQNGQDSPGYDSKQTTLIDPFVNFFGDFDFGNFPANDRQQLVQYLVSNKVYQYDPSKVATAQLNGKDVYVYPVQENAAKLKQFNLKVAAFMGADTSRVNPILTHLKDTSVKMYVTKDTHQLIKVENNGSVVTYQYNNLQALPPEPASPLTAHQFSQKLDAVGKS